MFKSQIAVILTALLLAEAAFANFKKVTVAPWGEKFFANNHGAIYLDLNVPDKEQLAGADLHVMNLVSKEVFIIPYRKKSVEDEADIEDVGMAGFRQDLYDKNSALYLYSLPAGSYRVVHLNLKYKKKEVNWTPRKKKKSFRVKPYHVSNLGTWIFKGGDANGKLSFRVRDNDYEPLDNSPVQGVIDGFSGIVQEKFKGSNKLRTNQQVTLGTYKYKRTISMFYTVNLLKHSQFTKDFTATLKQSDQLLRSCYLDHVDDMTVRNGNLNFTVVYSNTSKSLKSVKFKGGSLNYPMLTQCLYEKLQTLKFNIDRSMVGRIKFMFKMAE